MTSIEAAIPTDYTCVKSHNLGSAQIALLHYYTDIRTQRSGTSKHVDCDIYLIQDERSRKKYEPGSGWELIWQGKRPAERKESFRLYQKVQEPAL
jgi:hypothetical protein